MEAKSSLDFVFFAIHAVFMRFGVLLLGVLRVTEHSAGEDLRTSFGK